MRDWRLIAIVGAVCIIAVNCVPPRADDQLRLDDVHSKLNASRQKEVLRPTTVEDIQEMVRRAKREGLSISISGGRHSMGGQQFGEGTLHLDMSSYHRIVALDEQKHVVRVEAGIEWPALIEGLLARQVGKSPQWSIRQKQTGADKLSIGGALSSNIHGRGLTIKPLIDDVESFVLVDGEGNLRNCSRTENPELFRLVIGGYGLFGVIATVDFRLYRRQKLVREVKIIDVGEFIPSVKRKVSEGTRYGDFQFSIDDKSDEFLRKGVLSVYSPIDDGAAMPAEHKELKVEDWKRLYLLAHIDKAKAFRQYSEFYLSSSGQRYFSDTHQASVYIDDYHLDLDQKLGAKVPGTEMISEVYVPRERLPEFLTRAAETFRKTNANVIYGTIRLIQKDDESFLAWAKKDWACIVFNLHVDHSPDGIERAATQFRALIDRALEFGGSYFLTYHRWARRDQVLKAYPQFTEFLRLKRKYDPAERFQSDWYRHYRQMFADQPQ